LDDIIVFDILSPEVIRHIVDIKIKVIRERLMEKEFRSKYRERLLIIWRKKDTTLTMERDHSED
jgi:ATP-dependent Clp protease ATP-binding subunit ClpA